MINAGLVCELHNMVDTTAFFNYVKSSKPDVILLLSYLEVIPSLPVFFFLDCSRYLDEIENEIRSRYHEDFFF